MPWTPDDAPAHTKRAETASQKKLWAKIANEERSRQIEHGKSEDEADTIAVRAANSVLARQPRFTNR